MSPANIEAKLKAAGALIGQAIAVGDSKPFNVAGLRCALAVSGTYLAVAL